MMVYAYKNNGENNMGGKRGRVGREMPDYIERADLTRRY